ncbi:MAG: hypothetical protein V3W41_18540 [Planctomycetota bacterium]
MADGPDSNSADLPVAAAEAGYDRMSQALAEAWRQVKDGAELAAIGVQFDEAVAASEALQRALAGNEDESGQRGAPELGLDPSLDPDLRRQLEDRLRSDLEVLENDARELFSDDLAAPLQRGRDFAVLRLRSRLLRRATRCLVGRSSLDELPFLLFELSDLENSLGGRAPSEVSLAARPAEALSVASPAEALSVASPNERAAPNARTNIARLRQRLLLRHAEDLFESLPTGDLSSAADLELAFRRVRELSSLDSRLALHTRSEDQQSEAVALRDRVLTARLELEARAFERAEAATDADSVRATLQVASHLIDNMDEARLAAYDLASASPAFELRHLAGNGERMAKVVQNSKGTLNQLGRSHFEADFDDLKRRAKSSARRLRRLSGRLGDLANDRTMRDRIEGVFGPRLVRAWEIMIFWLIIGVLGLIVADHYRDLDPDGQISWTVWADTAICIILLYDLAVRVFLSPRRGRYFLRHFVTDFLPSLPFALLLNLTSVRALRFLRLVRVAPRIMQSLFRVFRLLLFVARAMDRLVERNAWLLNRNIVFFTDPVKDEGEHVLDKRMRGLDTWIRRAGSALFNDLIPEVQSEAAQWRMAAVEAALPLADGLEDSPSGSNRVRAGSQEMDVDDVIARLRETDDRQVADVLGMEFARNLNSSLRFFRIPFVRKIPVVRFVLGPSGVPDPLVTTARLSHVLGDSLAFAQRAINWFADLYGTITGAQFLDRLGFQMIKATARPTKRIFAFVAAIGLLWVVVKIVNVGNFFDVYLDAFINLLDGPIVFLAALCVIPLALGIWFRRIAGQATDFYERVAEAQFLALTEIDKEKRGAQDLVFLADRVLFPEAKVMSGATAEALAEIRAEIAGRPDELAAIFDKRGIESRVDFVQLFYRDFVDGAWFHHNDTKVANMLLGNLTLENIRRHRIKQSRRRKKQLDRLDIGRGKGGITGPYVWFNFITHSVAQETARLIIEYNQHAIPIREVESADIVDRKIYDAWCARRRRLTEARQRGIELRPESADDSAPKSSDGTLTFRTTEFNALHFLSDDPMRHARVVKRYGEEIANMLVEDRENLIRRVFGTFPMHELSREKRTFNPYGFYRRFGARGRVFLAPFWLLFFAAKVFRILSRRLLLIVRDVIDPDSRPLETSSGRADFDVAKRKIHRMRRPVVLEAIRLRADFDFEYLGISLPGERSSQNNPHSVAADLERINASEREWEEFRVIKSERQHRIRLLAALLKRAAQGETFEVWIARVRPSVFGHEKAALRALALALAGDLDGTASLLDAQDRLRDLLTRVKGGTQAAPRRPGVLRSWSKIGIRRGLKHSWRWLANEQADDKGLYRKFVDAISLHDEALQDALSLLAHREDLKVSPDELVLEKLLASAVQPSSWSEQIVAVRTVQSLGMLDLMGYEGLIGRLGGYESSAQDTGELLSPKELSTLF